jgi:hypothetical protein
MSLANNDENKTFGVVLRTPVENSKGIPHILEHSVLCGSRKYPIKVSTERPAALQVSYGCLVSLSTNIHSVISSLLLLLNRSPSWS